MESLFNKIIRKTGSKPVACKCQKCKSQCMKAPCLGTPEDIEKIIDAGYADKISETTWASGVVMGVTSDIVNMFQAKHNPVTGCSFFKDGLCQLHDSGLKPTEGKLSYHEVKTVSNPNKVLSWAVAKEWLAPENAETIKRIAQKINCQL